MKKILLLCLPLVILLSACSKADSSQSGDQTQMNTRSVLTAVNHYTLEPDEVNAISDDKLRLYKDLIDAVLTGSESAPADSSAEHNELLLGLLRESPYYFFVDTIEPRDGNFYITYNYTAEQRAAMLSQMDARLLEIANHDADESDNELDVILKVYHAVTTLEYDYDREKDEVDPNELFFYPGDEVYRTLTTGKGLCYSFAYIFRLALLQHGIDCFTVHGMTGEDSTPHMWDIFCYDDTYFYCDPTWDRCRDAYSRLNEFGKTEDERAADSVIVEDFDAYHFSDYGPVRCTDDRFSIFRGINRFSPAGEHSFLVENYKGEQKLFYTDTMKIK